LEKNKTKTNNELGLLAVWKDARPYEKEIELEILNSFKLIQKIEMNWTNKNFYINSCRLYETPFSSNNIQEQSGKGHTKKIGSPNFLIYIIQDENPNYRYVPSVSGSIELCNTNIVSLKEKLRAYVYERTKELYSIHSTNNFNEFCFQAPLLFGLDNSRDFIEGKNISLNKTYKSDLIGSDGWNSYRDLFKALNATCNYVVLRGFEQLPDKNPEKDLDILTDDFQRLASLLGIFQSSSQPYKGTIFVAGEQVPVDIRHIGDHYFDIRFQINVLSNRQLKKGIYVPRDDDYFFSLLYHCKVHKGTVKPKYFDILENLALKLDLNWFEKSMLNDDTKIKNILVGYYRAHRYNYVPPIDEGVYVNKVIVDALPTNNPRFNILRTVKEKIRLITPNLLLDLRRSLMIFIYK